MNLVHLIGYCTKKPILQTTASGTAYTNFTLAVKKNYKNQDGTQDADFILIAAWRNRAELVSKYLDKGSRIAIVGRINSRSYDNTDGKRVFVTEVLLENLEFLDSKKKEDLPVVECEKTVEVLDAPF